MSCEIFDESGVAFLFQLGIYISGDDIHDYHLIGAYAWRYIVLIEYILFISASVL